MKYLAYGAVYICVALILVRCIGAGNDPRDD